jgi:hypothetical protein
LNAATTMNASGDPWFFTVTLFFISVTIISGLTALFMIMRRRAVQRSGSEAAISGQSDPVPVTRNAPSKHLQKFYGVSVQPGINACAAVEKIRGRRYLTLKGPRLPLPNCSIADCRCVLRPENDRRAGFDRRDDSFSAYGDFKTHRFDHGRGERIERRKK